MSDGTTDDVIQTEAQQHSAPSDQHYAFKDLALLQAFSNVMLTSFSAVSNRWAGGDFVSWTIFCAFFWLPHPTRPVAFSMAPQRRRARCRTAYYR